jgi:ketosteroid isomerase-like protein
MMRWKSALMSLTVACFGAAMFFGIGAVRASQAQSGASSKPQLTEEQALSLQKRFQDASLAADGSTVSSLMADDAIFVHGSAAAQTKTEYVSSLTSGQLKLSTYKLNENKVVLFDGGAIVSGLTDVGLASPNGGPPRMLRLRISTVWIHEPAGWQIILNQGTPLAGPPPAAH